jgi:hypothetical protein
MTFVKEGDGVTAGRADAASYVQLFPRSQPDSSAASRRAASAAGSPNSTLPPGGSHHPARRPSA